uniref:Uncharacterized protein n=1 Tax=Cacopsylla melanoneura TaxID=428564 RepID=A0A8D8UAK9_9HEMI
MEWFSRDFTLWSLKKVACGAFLTHVHVGSLTLPKGYLDTCLAHSSSCQRCRLRRFQRDLFIYFGLPIESIKPPPKFFSGCAPDNNKLQLKGNLKIKHNRKIKGPTNLRISAEILRTNINFLNNYHFGF